MALQAKLEQAARRAGAEVPARRFVPHVTLARLKGRQEDAAPLAEWLGARGSVSLPPARITSFTLFASHLGPDGPDYEALADYPLGA